jgi:TRAP-type mannitol/chloroaromatic compound transport system substrate-binding protein
MTLSFTKNTKKEIIALTHGILFSSFWMIICYFLKNHHTKEGLTTKITKPDEKDKEEALETSKSPATSPTQDSSITIGSGTIAKNTVSKMSNGDISIQNFNSNNIISLSGMINITIPSGIVDTICGLSKTSS